MHAQISRRGFLAAAGAAAFASPAAGAAAFASPAAADSIVPLQGRIKKAVKYHMIEGPASIEDKLRLVKDLGFEGVEPRSSYHQRRDVEPKLLAAAAEKVGIAVHGVVNSASPKLREAIDEARMYGATSVLTTLPAMPRNGSYIENYHRTQRQLQDAASYAEKHEVHVLIENVWASFLIEPLTMARYVDEIDSPFVGVYFDVGNVVRWGWPHHWIEVLGKRIIKLDIKEYDLKVAMSEGMRRGFAAPIGKGSVDWKKVREQLAKINYRGWATAEVAGGDRKRLAEIAGQMNDVLGLSLK